MYIPRFLRGVCQGSVLGTLLFLVYINDLPNCLQIIESLLFADDNQLFAEDDDWTSLAQKLNADMINVVNGYVVNRMPVHPDKTSLTFFCQNFSNPRFRIPRKPDGTLDLNIKLDFNIDNSIPYDASK